MTTRSTTVFLLGPSPEQTGGISSVITDMLSIDVGPHYRFEFVENTSSPGPREVWLSRIARHARHALALHRRFSRERGAIVHIHTCSGVSFWRSCVDLVLARRAGCQTLLHIHGARFDRFYAACSRVQRRLLAAALRYADAVIVLSRSWEEAVRQMSPEARLMVMENAVPVPDAPPERDHAGPVRFLLLARMDDWKGVDDLLDACALATATQAEFELTLAGPPGTAGDAETLAGKISDRGLSGIVRYVGEVRGEAKRILLETADVYVQPSRHEGMPISILEAMAAGLPIVATRVGAVPEVIASEQQGLLVSAEAPLELASAMCAMIEDAALRRRTGAAAHRLAAERFSLTRLGDELRRCYGSLTLNRRPRARAKGERGFIPCGRAGLASTTQMSE